MISVYQIILVSFGVQQLLMKSKNILTGYKTGDTVLNHAHHSTKILKKQLQNQSANRQRLEPKTLPGKVKSLSCSREKILLKDQCTLYFF